MSSEDDTDPAILVMLDRLDQLRKQKNPDLRKIEDLENRIEELRSEAARKKEKVQKATSKPQRKSQKVKKSWPSFVLVLLTLVGLVVLFFVVWWVYCFLKILGTELIWWPYQELSEAMEIWLLTLSGEGQLFFILIVAFSFLFVPVMSLGLAWGWNVWGKQK